MLLLEFFIIKSIFDVAAGCLGKQRGVGLSSLLPDLFAEEAALRAPTLSTAPSWTPKPNKQPTGHRPSRSPGPHFDLDGVRAFRLR